MGVPTSKVSYTSATTGRGDHKVHKGHVVLLGKEKKVLVGLQDPVEDHQIATYIKQTISVSVVIVLHNCEFRV
jgi:hypothetical protein